MIGAVIERVLLSEVNFGHSVLFALRESRRNAILYSSAHCCMQSRASLERLSQLKIACDDLASSQREPAQALVPLDAFRSDMGTEVSQSNLAPVHRRDAAAVGYAFLVSNERSTMLYGLARCDCEAPFSLEETQKLRRFAPTVWGALKDCLSLTEIQEPFTSSPLLARDHGLGRVSQCAQSSLSCTNALVDFSRACGVSLSPKETAVANQSLRGESAKAIAAGLCISPHTVNIHMRNIYRKFHVKNRTQLHSAYANFVMVGARPMSPSSSNPSAQTGNTMKP